MGFRAIVRNELGEIRRSASGLRLYDAADDAVRADANNTGKGGKERRGGDPAGAIPR